MTLRVLIADDELLARKRLHRLLGDLPGIEVVGEAIDGTEVLRQIARLDVHVVLLDIQMPGLSGLDAASLLPDDGPDIVFVTAHAEHAVEAFEHAAVDYVLKPVEPERLARALARAAYRRSPAAIPATAGSDKLAVQTLKGVLLLSPQELTHAVIEGETVELHGDRGPLFTDLRLADLERRLPSPPFERVHRRVLVNLDRVHRLEPTPSGGYLAHTDLGAVVDVSRQAARRLRRRFGLV